MLKAIDNHICFELIMIETTNKEMVWEKNYWTNQFWANKVSIIRG